MRRVVRSGYMRRLPKHQSVTEQDRQSINQAIREVNESIKKETVQDKDSKSTRIQ